jgi:hypothetical protein
MKKIIVDGDSIIQAGTWKGSIDGEIEINGPQEVLIEQNRLEYLKYIDGQVVLGDVEAIDAEIETTEKLKETDNDLIRVIEDIVDVLVAKNLIKIDDLPQAAQEKINYRKGLRNG